MSDDKYYAFRDGLPTGPEVNTIRERWPDLKVGDRVLYSDIAELLKITIGGNRFRAVTTAWRRAMKDERLTIECETNTAFYVASGEQVHALTDSVTRQIGRKARSQREKLANAAAQATDKTLAAKCQHAGSLMHVLERESKKARMNLIPQSNPVAEVTRIQPPSNTKSGT